MSGSYIIIQHRRSNEQYHTSQTIHVNPNHNDCVKLLHLDNITRTSYYSFSKFVHCIYAIRTCLCGTYIVFTRYHAILHHKTYSMVNVWFNLSPIPLSKRITVTFIDVKYEYDVNAVTLLKQ